MFFLFLPDFESLILKPVQVISTKFCDTEFSKSIISLILWSIYYSKPIKLKPQRGELLIEKLIPEHQAP